MEESSRRKSTSSESELSDGWNLVDTVEMVPAETSDAESIEVLHEEYTESGERKHHETGEATETKQDSNEISPSNRVQTTKPPFKIRELFECGAVFIVVALLALASSYALLTFEEGLTSVKPLIWNAVSPPRKGFAHHELAKIVADLEAYKQENQKLIQELENMYKDVSSNDDSTVFRKEKRTRNPKLGGLTEYNHKELTNKILNDEAFPENILSNYLLYLNFVNYEKKLPKEIVYIDEATYEIVDELKTIVHNSNTSEARNASELFDLFVEDLDIIVLLTDDTNFKHFAEKWHTKVSELIVNVQMEVGKMVNKINRHISKSLSNIHYNFIKKFCNKKMQFESSTGDKGQAIFEKQEEICMRSLEGRELEKYISNKNQPALHENGQKYCKKKDCGKRFNIKQNVDGGLIKFDLSDTYTKKINRKEKFKGKEDAKYERSITKPKYQEIGDLRRDNLRPKKEILNEVTDSHYKEKSELVRRENEGKKYNSKVELDNKINKYEKLESKEEMNIENENDNIIKKKNVYQKKEKNYKPKEERKKDIPYIDANAEKKHINVVETCKDNEENCESQISKEKKDLPGKKKDSTYEPGKKKDSTYEPGMKKDEPGTKKDSTYEPGKKKDSTYEPGMKKDEPGMKKDEPGMKKDEPGMKKDSTYEPVKKKDSTYEPEKHKERIPVKDKKIKYSKVFIKKFDEDKKSEEEIETGESGPKKNSDFIIDKIKNENMESKEKKRDLEHNSNSTGGSWFLTLGKGRAKIRSEHKKSDWVFERAKGRFKNKEESKWVFDRAFARERCRENPKLSWCNENLQDQFDQDSYVYR